jgi:hypothetical protein
MTHNAKTWPCGLGNGVSNVDAYELERLDAGQFAAVNGDDGGTWNPTTPIRIGGAGTQITLAAGVYLPFADGVRTFVRSLNPMPVNRMFGGASFDATEVAGNVTGNGAGSGFQQSIPVPYGATLLNVRTYVQVTGGHATLPGIGPGLTILSVPIATLPTGETELNSTDTISLALPANVGIYNALGFTYWDYPCIQNNTSIDTSTKAIIAIMNDESGGGQMAGNIFYGFQITYTMTTFQPQ